MSVNLHIVGFRPPDEKWKQMKEVWDACKKAEIKVPSEVDMFFESVAPDNTGVEIDTAKLKSTGALNDWHNDYADGFEIDIQKLPKDIRIIRCYLS